MLNKKAEILSFQQLIQGLEHIELDQLQSDIPANVDAELAHIEAQSDGGSRLPRPLRAARCRGRSAALRRGQHGPARVHVSEPHDLTTEGTAFFSPPSHR